MFPPGATWGMPPSLKPFYTISIWWKVTFHMVTPGDQVFCEHRFPTSRNEKPRYLQWSIPLCTVGWRPAVWGAVRIFWSLEGRWWQVWTCALNAFLLRLQHTSNVNVAYTMVSCSPCGNGRLCTHAFCTWVQSTVDLKGSRASHQKHLWSHVILAVMHLCFLHRLLWWGLTC